VNTVPDRSGLLDTRRASIRLAGRRGSPVRQLRRFTRAPVVAAFLVLGGLSVVGCGGDTTTVTRTVTVPAGTHMAATPTALRAEAPVLSDIGAGLKGPSGLAAAVIVRGVTNVSDFALDRSGRLFVTRASEGAHRGDGVYLLARDEKPRPVVTQLAAPLGLTFVGDDLYVASEKRVDRYSDFTGDGFGRHKTILSGLPAGKLGWNDKAGPAEIAFRNPAVVPHDVEIARDGEPLAKTKTVTEGTATASVTLEPGTDSFYCTVPGHQDAGMTGTLTVK
jgi:hypothetical protein